MGRAVRGEDTGSATVLVLALVGMVLLLAAGIGVLGGAQSARLGAQTAADLGALAAADSIAVPAGVRLGAGLAPARPPCALAADVVRRNAARPGGCTALPGGVVEVVAVRSTPIGPATAVARAGPASARSP